MKRMIFMDTETTGLSPFARDEHGDQRLVELACVEAVDGALTGSTLHLYVDPERPVPAGAYAVHKLDWETCKEKSGGKKFADVAQQLLDYVGSDILVFHNAPFDIHFLNYELTRAGYPKIPESQVLCTLKIAKDKYPGDPKHSLDFLAGKYGIDNSKRVEVHSAIEDTKLLGLVYYRLIEGVDMAEVQKNLAGGVYVSKSDYPNPMGFAGSLEEVANLLPLVKPLESGLRKIKKKADELTPKVQAGEVVMESAKVVQKNKKIAWLDKDVPDEERFNQLVKAGIKLDREDAFTLKPCYSLYILKGVDKKAFETLASVPVEYTLLPAEANTGPKDKFRDVLDFDGSREQLDAVLPLLKEYEALTRAVKKAAEKPAYIKRVEGGEFADKLAVDKKTKRIAWNVERTDTDRYADLEKAGVKIPRDQAFKLKSAESIAKLIETEHKPLFEAFAATPVEHTLG